MEQVFIFLTGGVAIWLTQDDRAAWRRYACLFGLAGQPFWFYSAYTGEQWGILGLCVFYTIAWARGVLRHWVHNNEKGAST